ncbi:TonB-dependent receptor [Steroidobacter cummioxidans]|uniref:TonB-dependent receptor n=1 Tax=Steroidobacter cummioxidans TaxID=1803913 RepID=UPI000E31C47D|nr:TonB-dependent receptor [Steroidobacter cummioxidans]
MTTKRRGLVLAGASAALCMSPFDLPAQDQQRVQGANLEEVIVSARKRDESVLDVPVAINVFTAADIAAAGIDRPGDFIQLTPNMSLVQTQNQGTSFVTVRGISQARNSEPSVAVLIDGVLMVNPSQFNQELVDIESIQVLKGPQGALYGRNAIGGAIIVNTKRPSDTFESSITAGYESGPGQRLRGSVSGPISDTLKYRVAASYFETDGYIDNALLGEEADPFRDVSTRVRLLWEPSEAFTADLRFNSSQVDTQALYFNITESVNDTSLPVRVNNPGVNERDMYGVSLKLDFETRAGTFTSVSSYDTIKEILTGDQFNFLPIPESVLFQFFGADQAQHQYLDVDAISQELRFTSPTGRRVRWIAGMYGIATDRFISTGNVFDLGTGVVPQVRRQPLPLFNPQFTYLADSQDNFAWAVFGNVDVDLTPRVEMSLAMRYDRDERENTTKTPAEFIPASLVGLAQPGQVRKHTWDEWQPKVTLRFKPTDDSMLFAGYSRGFRSGGFNQTGVSAAGIAGIQDLFDAETASTYEVGAKAEFFDRRLSASVNAYYTRAEGSYFFVFDPNTSTQNLGNLGRVDYQGIELELKAALADGFDAFLGLGYTDSEIKQSDRAATDVGNQAPLVSEYSANLGLQYRRHLGDVLSLLVRTDFEAIGPTWFYPDNATKRDPVELLNARLGLEGGRWAATVWAKNLTNEEYNAEWSPGPQFFPNPGYTNNFVFKALPRRWGVDLTYRF